ncbi:Alpha/beta hydrolase family protein [Roseovarius litorisediminis]|uniref:Alpha/beta hydrolase family protein n=1 Tax=Roseovarius litorisediminis TaxID=1312363 RepID=A0A1Y5T4I0_9RHOB|nr:alpha/beta fold hydrolase [Roseovarius litorisediminis]SLN52164.1 Alpha/beta hydrolase family protein [Roseovarius litorisediminis]
MSGHGVKRAQDRSQIARWSTAPRIVSLVFIVTMVAASCAPRNTAQRAAAHPSARIEPIYVATQRELNRTGPVFGEQRPRDVNYFRADISVPSTHESGLIEWPKGPPDAATDFVVIDTQVFGNSSAFVRQVHAETPGRETLVFVHGYNNTLSESMYRLAQIQTDFETGMPSVLFSWPSAGDPRGYIYDRDSILFSRDDLEETLKVLTTGSGEKVFLIAHSLGSHLVMEVLRQAAQRGDRRLLNRISGVVLMSPDIDPDLFRRQAEAIGKLPQPFFIFISRQDRALSLAGFLTGQKPRLGVIDAPEQMKGLDVTVVDFTELADGEGFNHFVPVTSPAAITVLNGMIDQAGRRGTGFGKFMVLKAQP